MGKRRVIAINEELCDGCGECTMPCVEGAIKIIDGKARVVGEDFCDGAGGCMDLCPVGAMSIVEKEF